MDNTYLTGLALEAVWPTLCRITRVLLVVPPVLLVLLWGWYQYRYWRILVVARRLPTLSPSPKIIGHLYLALFGLKNLVNSLTEAGKRIAAKGTKIACMWFGPLPVFLVLKEEDAKTILTSAKTSEKSREYHFIKFALGRGLLTAPGDTHKITRRYLNPLFQPANLALLAPAFNRCGRHIVTGLSQHVATGAPVNLLRVVTPAILRNTATGLFGPDAIIENKSEGLNCLLGAMKGITKIAVNRILKLWLWSDSVFQYLWSKEISKIFSYRDKFVDGCIKEMANYKESNSCDDMTDGNRNVHQAVSLFTEPRARTLFDAYDDLQKTHPQFTKQDLLNEIMTLMITGTDSSNITICSCLLALAAFPNIQNKVYNEVISVAGVEDKDVSVEELNKLVYLEQVVKETLRKFTVSPLILRRVEADTQLSECTIPAGSTVGVSLISLHHDPELFPDPDTFDPDRFSPSNAAKLNKYSYLPFSGGSRGCIGKAYAIMLVKTVLVHVLRRYRLSTTVDIDCLKFNIGVILYSSTGYPVQIHDHLAQ